MTPARATVIIAAGLVCSFAGGAVGAQWNVASTYLGYRVHAGDDAPEAIGAQIQSVGDEGGIAVVTRNTNGENFILGMQPFWEGGPLRKTWSWSGVVVDHDQQNGYGVTRINTAYRQNGMTLDNILQVYCGGHGVVINPRDPWARGECPGMWGTRINGTLYIDHLVVGGVPVY